LPLLEKFVCAFKKSNPKLKLLVATVKGDLSAPTLAKFSKLDVELIFWDELAFPNAKSARFALNWVKIRAWEMDEYDSILMVDADTAVVGDVSHIFSLPAHFAAANDQDKSLPRFTSLGSMQGGVVFLRPCSAVAQHMVQILEKHDYLRFSKGHAEQTFFDWYFRFERWTLPIEYNAIAHKLQSNLQTVSGIAPVIVHYAKFKPFTIDTVQHPDQVYAVC
jgi:hypothetical protein